MAGTGKPSLILVMLSSFGRVLALAVSNSRRYPNIIMAIQRILFFMRI
jgi:hypothetical protein